MSRPVGWWDQQKQLWSGGGGKKHQHSVNVLFITAALDGTILYYSNYNIGANDQALWNKLEQLRNKFIGGKNFGIAGDGGFTFNRKVDEVLINGYKPYKAHARTPLTEQQKKYNKYLSQMRGVIVENAIISRVKRWKIMKGIYRHFKGNQHQLDLHDILAIVAALTNKHM